jgi:transcriptional regulator with XRE-family HTH domain
MITLKQLVASAIKESRLKHGLQQQDLAAVIGVTRNSISNIEHGKQAVSLSMFCKIADALNEDPGIFLDRILETKPEPTISKEDVDDLRVLKLIKKTIK